MMKEPFGLGPGHPGHRGTPSAPKRLGNVPWSPRTWISRPLGKRCDLDVPWDLDLFVVSGLFCLVYFVQEKGEDVSKVRYVGRTAGVMAPKRIGSVGIGRVDPISL